MIRSHLFIFEIFHKSCDIYICWLISAPGTLVKPKIFLEYFAEIFSEYFAEILSPGLTAGLSLRPAGAGGEEKVDTPGEILQRSDWSLQGPDYSSLMS